MSTRSKGDIAKIHGTEKTKLIDSINQSVSDFTTAGNESLPPYIGIKDN